MLSRNVASGSLDDAIIPARSRTPTMNSTVLATISLIVSANSWNSGSAISSMTSSRLSESRSKIGFAASAAISCRFSMRRSDRPLNVLAWALTRSMPMPRSPITLRMMSSAGTPCSLRALIALRGRLNRSMTEVKSPLTASRSANAAPSMPSAMLLAPSCSATVISSSTGTNAIFEAGIRPCTAWAISSNENTELAARSCSMLMIRSVSS